MTHWSDAGFGTDPEGDALRRAEQGVVELPDGTRIAGDPPPEVLAAHGLPAIPLGAALPDGRNLDDLRAEADPLAGLLNAPVTFDPARVVSVEEEAPDPHKITSTRHGAAVALVCACGRWEAVVSGRGSAAWAGDDYRRHVADETAAGDA